MFHSVSPIPFLLFALAPLATAQSNCGTWSSGFELPGAPFTIRAVADFDDGSGLKAYAGGGNVSQPVPSALSSFDGTAWRSVPGAPTHGIYALAAFDSGADPALYVGGLLHAPDSNFEVLRWNGTVWNRAGSSTFNRAVDCFQVFDDGSGSKLYAGGAFSSYGAQSMPLVARWNGTNWQALTDFTGLGVKDLRVFDDGTGSALYVAGEFHTVAGLPARSVVRYGSGGWSMLGAGLPDGTAGPFAVHDLGSGPQLIVGFRPHNQNVPASLHAWDGAQWNVLTSPALVVHYRIEALRSFDDGAGAKLYLGSLAGLNRLDGGTWTSLVGGATYDLSESSTAPGFLLSSGEHGVGGWNGTVLSPIGTAAGVPSGSRSLCVHDDGTGKALYIAEWNLTPVGQVRRRDAHEWTQLGGSFAGAGIELMSLGAGAESRLIAIGGFTSIGGVPFPGAAQWDGASWQPLQGLVPAELPRWNGPAVVLDDGTGPAVYYRLNTAQFRLMRWRPGESTILQSSLIASHVNSVVSIDDGSGPHLYASGAFSVGGLEARRQVRRHNQGIWELVLDGLEHQAHTFFELLVHDDGAGPALYTTGYFTEVGGVPANNVARILPGPIRALGGGFAEGAAMMVSVDLGRGFGPELVLGRTNSTPSSAFLSSWNGSTWTQLANPAACVGSVDGFAVLPTLDDHDLYVTGYLSSIDGVPSSNLARLPGCGEVGRTFCHGDGSATACPCGNASASVERAGCLNSLGTAGTVRARGVSSLNADTLVLDGSGMTNSSALYFQGTSLTNGGLGSTFGDGVACVGGPFVRLGTKQNQAGASQYPSALDSSVSVRGHVTASGTRRYAVRYRNVVPFCAPEGFNYTNGVEIVWVP